MDFCCASRVIADFAASIFLVMAGISLERPGMETSAHPEWAACSSTLRTMPERGQCAELQAMLPGIS